MLPGTDLRRGQCEIADRTGGEWWLCGPFENADNWAMAQALPPESQFDPEADYDGGFQEGSPWRSDPAAPAQHTARWVRRRETHGFIDFNHVFRPRTRGVSVCWPAAAIATTCLEAPDDCQASLRLAWDDDLSLWINGEQVRDRARHQAFRHADMQVPLKPGRNHVLLELSNTRGTTWGAWCFSFRAALPDGERLLPKADTAWLTRRSRGQDEPVAPTGDAGEEGDVTDLWRRRFESPSES
jgi:hypothetical protein